MEESIVGVNSFVSNWYTVVALVAHGEVSVSFDDIGYPDRPCVTL